MALVETRNINTKYKSRCISAPLLRRRTLDEFPMVYTTNEAVMMACNWRTQRLTNSEKLSKVYADSDNLRQYSRKRFDYVVNKVKSDIVANQRISCNKLCVQAYSGPSRYGSPLYNKTPSLLSAIRLRPSSQIGPFEHEPKPYPDIQRTLSQSNCNFTVAYHQPHIEVSTCSTPGFSDISEYILVPKSCPADSAKANLCQWTNINEESIPQEPISELVEDTKTNHRRSRDKILEVISSSQSTCSGELILVAVQSTESETDQSQEPQPDQKNVGKPDAPVKPISVKKPNTPQVVPKSKKTRPKCWVDDVTVSSDLSVDSPPDDVYAEDKTNPPEQQGYPVDSVNHHTLPEPMSSTQPLPALAEQTHHDGKQVDILKQESIIQDLNILNLDDIKGKKIDLPKFLCPSSETKSRQTAITDWLASTSFTCANRQIPLF